MTQLVQKNRNTKLSLETLVEEQYFEFGRFWSEYIFQSLGRLVKTGDFH
jgi:hypothetical protein